MRLALTGKVTRAVAVLGIGLAMSVAGLAANQGSVPKSISGSTGSEGWYTSAQAARGAKLFAQHCAVCHGAKLQGGAGPTLVGKQFFLRYGGKPLSQLWFNVHTQMPLNAPSSLPNPDSLAIIAFILKANGFPEGASPIVGHYDTSRIIPSSAPGAVAKAPSTVAKAPMVVQQPSTDLPSQAELNAADSDADNWLTYGKGYRGARYSSLTDISTANVAQLRLVCAVQLAAAGSFQSSPIAYNGVLYVTTTNGTFAVDGQTCAKLWSYQYEASDVEAGANNKGVAIGAGRVIRGTTDGHLIALDVKTGKLLWDRKVMDSSVGASALIAPLIWNDLVFMTKAGGDLGIRGEVMAFHVSDGTKVWGFSSIPTDGETGAGSWPNAAVALHGGGATWTAITLDPDTGTLFVPIGNPSPDFNTATRPGANLFSTGIVALDAATGKLSWSYQTQPNDYHDWDATGTAQFDMADGRKLLAATAKDGYVHLLDRTSGKLLTKTAITTIENVEAPISTSGTRYCPGAAGGEEWNGAAWDPALGLVFSNSVDWCTTVKLAPPAKKGAAGLNVSDFGGGIPLPDPMTKAAGWTTAIDPATGGVRWHIKMPTPMLAAVTPTAGGLLFTGNLNGEFLALDAASGGVLFRYDTRGALAGGIITYRAGGKQFVAAASGNTSFVAWKVTGKPTLVVFSL